MKFMFKTIVMDSAACTTFPAGDIRELTEAQATLYAGRNLDHLEPADASAKAFLDKLRGKEPAEKDEGPSRDDLIEQAKALGVKGAAQMKKADLIEAIAKAAEKDEE